MTRIFFNYADIALQYNQKRNLKVSVSKLFDLEKVSISRIDYVFCTDLYLLQLNQQHLQHNTLTDIITFDLSNNKETIIGEIYISIERIRENASTHNVSFANELNRVVFHGALHLCGYKDKSSDEKKTMRKMEDKYLKMFHVEQ
jgi:probable rRNA maturation factor